MNFWIRYIANEAKEEAGDGGGDVLSTALLSTFTMVGRTKRKDLSSGAVRTVFSISTMKQIN